MNTLLSNPVGKAVDRPVVLITGCSTGIGRATALYLADHGWYVYATARRLESIEDLASDTIRILQLDVTDESSRVAAVETLLAEQGRIDALVNNAGYGVIGTLEEMDLEKVRLQFETNTLGALRLCQLVIPTMRAARKGRIINIGSGAAIIPIPGIASYCATKRALEAISDALRIELYPWGIKVVMIEPSAVRTQWSRTAQRSMESSSAVYAAMMQRVQMAVEFLNAPDTPGPEVIARIVHQALSVSRPHPRYVGTPGCILRWLLPLAQWLPLSWQDWIKTRYYWGGTSKASRELMGGNGGTVETALECGS